MSMKLFATSFSLVLGSWRLRFSIDLDDETFIAPAAPHHLRFQSDARARERAGGSR
jgi:hypothetical protein